MTRAANPRSGEMAAPLRAPHLIRDKARKNTINHLQSPTHTPIPTPPPVAGCDAGGNFVYSRRDCITAAVVWVTNS